MPSVFCPTSLKAASMASCIMDNCPCMVWLPFSDIWKNFPPSDVALMKASCTISALIAPLLISSFSCDTLFPVWFAISVRGLKPALIIWSKSCPISLPVADICEKARVSELKFCLLPIEMSPIAWIYRGTFSASILNPTIIFVAAVISPNSNGEILA